MNKLLRSSTLLLTGKNTTEKSDSVGFTYKQQYAVVVICKDEKEQESIYNRLKEGGFKLKVVAV